MIRCVQVQKIIFINHQFFLAILIYVLRIVTEEKKKERNEWLYRNAHKKKGEVLRKHNV